MMDTYGVSRIDPSEEKSAVESVLKKWPKRIQDNFKAFQGNAKCVTFEQWIVLLKIG